MKNPRTLRKITFSILAMLCLITSCSAPDRNANAGNETAGRISAAEDRNFLESFSYELKDNPETGKYVVECNLSVDFFRTGNPFLELTDSITIDFQLASMESPWIFDAPAGGIIQLRGQCGEEPGDVFNATSGTPLIPTDNPIFRNEHWVLKPVAPICDASKVHFSGGLIVVVIESLTDPVIGLSPAIKVNHWYHGTKTPVLRQES